MHRRRGETLVKKDNENWVDGGVYLYRTKEDSNSTSSAIEVTEGEYIKSIGDNEYVQMQYLSPDEFEDLVTTNNTTAKYKYTVDEETEQLVIANVKSVEIITTEDSKPGDAKIEKFSEVEKMNVDYKQYISKYTMPYEFLITLCEITQNPEFVYHVALLARETNIILTVQDDTTIEKVTVREEKKYESYENRSDNSTSGASLTGTDTDKITTMTTTVTTVPHLEKEYANTWSFYEEYEYTKNIETWAETNGPITETPGPGATLGNYQEAGYVTHDAPEGGGYGRITYESEKWYDTFCVETTTTTETQITTTTYNPGILKNSVEKSKQFLGLLRNKEGKCVYDNCYEDHAQAIKCAKDAVFDRAGINVAYKIPNTTREEMPLNKLLSGEKMLYDLLGEGMEGDESLSAEEDENSVYKERMNGLVDHMKYLMGFPDNEEIEDYENSIDEPIEDDEYDDINVDDIIVKTDEQGALRAVSKEELYGIIMATYSGKRQSNALDILDTLIACQDTYKVNAIFVLAFADQESSIGTANTSHVRNNNWLSWNLGHKYSSPQENVETVMRNIANGNIYFTQGKITIKDIGLTYCPNTTDYPTQGDNWVINVTSKVKKMYAMIGIEIGDVGIDDNSETISVGGRTYKDYKQDSGSPWEKNSYAGGTMKSSGCGLTSIAIVLSGYGQDVTPEDVRQKVGGKLADLASVLNGYGISTSRPERTLTADEIKTHLGSNKPIIVNVNGEWTSSSGHYMVLAGYKESNGEDYVYVINPGTVNSSKNGWVKLSRITNSMKTRSIFITSD